MQRSTRLWRPVVLLVAIATLTLRAVATLAGATDPALGIAHAVARAAGSTTLLEIHGTWEFDNIVQMDFAPSVVVYSGSAFIRIPLGGAQALRGSFSGLADGLQASEVAALEGTGTVEPDAVIVSLDAHRMRIALPSDFGIEGFSVVTYVTVPIEGTFLSNAVTAAAYEVSP